MRGLAWVNGGWFGVGYVHGGRGRLEESGDTFLVGLLDWVGLRVDFGIWSWVT